MVRFPLLGSLVYLGTKYFIGIVDGAHPEFALSNAPSASSFRQLFKNLEAQAEDIVGKDGQSMYTNSFGSFIDIISPSKVVSHLHKREYWKNS